MPADREQIGRYLATMFGAAADAGMFFNIWTLNNRASSFFSDVREAIEYSEIRADQTDVYAGMGVFREPPGSGRGTYDDVAGLVAMWCDIDVADGRAHKKHNLPPSREAALALVREIGLQPSFTVNSGYGLHAYWLLTEPWIFSEKDRGQNGEAAVFCQRWAATIKAVATARGFGIDSVFDTTRVLRVAGTTNHKGGNRVPVTMDMPASPRRYNLDDLEPLMVAREYVVASRVAVTQIGFVRLDPRAKRPEKFAVLSANNEKFRETYDRNRPDLRDQSPSAFDLALASFAAAAGWTDQEIVDLLISCRRYHNDDLKLRLDYYQRTIGKARQGREVDAAIDRIVNDEVGPVDGTPPENVTVDDRGELLKNVSKMLGLSVVRWTKDGKYDANYTLVLSDGTQVVIGTSASVLNQTVFRARVYDATNIAIPNIKPDKWLKVMTKLGTIVEIVANSEANRQSTMLDWLRAYIPTQLVFRDDEWAKALPTSHPFVRDGQIHVHVLTLRQWLRVNLGESIDKAGVWSNLRAAGFNCVDVTARVDGRVVRRTYWAAQEGVLSVEHGSGGGQTGDAPAAPKGVESDA